MSPDPSVGAPTADFGTRFSAFMIDAGLLFAAQWIVFMVLSRQLQAVGLTSTEPCVPNGVALCQGPSDVLWVVLVLFFVVSTVGYHAVFEGYRGATPGKRWMGLVVVGAAGRTPPTSVAALLRSLIRQSFWLSLLFVLDVSPFGLGLPPVLFLIVPLLTLVDFVVGAVRPDGLAVHDMVAGTRVVRIEHARPLDPATTPGSTPASAPAPSAASGSPGAQRAEGDTEVAVETDTEQESV